MSKPKLFIVTGSPFKFQDLSAELGKYFDCEQKIWDQPEIQGDPEEIIRHKLKTVYDIFSVECPFRIQLPEDCEKSNFKDQSLTLERGLILSEFGSSRGFRNCRCRGEIR